MKRFLALLSVLVLSMSMLVGCGSKTADNDELVVYFVPSRDPAEIQKATKPLAEMLKAELSKLGYDFEKVRIEVGTSFEAVGEALSSGTAQVGFIPGGTYVLYDDGVDVALTATRFGLNHDSENPADWNTAPTENTNNKVKYYRSLVIAGPSEKGQKLAAKINNGEKLTLDDIQGATWGVSSNTTSPAGYIYPSLWLQENFGISITDLKSKVALDNYATSLSQLASGQIDVMVTYADARLDYVDQWNSNFGRTASIWDETNVIGVTDGIYNDTISVTKDASMTSELKEAIQQAFINIGNTEEGQKIISIYSHKGYEIGNSSDYDAEREAQKLIKSMQ
ncbi:MULTISPECIES: phosphate/phosphite/phosphonate ABC transporter substrate-binding protein [unclassified Clostridium]|jgi:phosphonate transport system substrate-binding protein|uniref:phosphate/phosphite/phosphonate ABC transporter substrate-binding protein n=1 Tax=unclassified Clostridium TaxID=2614128 RepID=UPI000340023D|nr:MULTISPECIES: PhnD/SsuA/transferrin family substrate-binding protein [unclassified Clostridium]OKZ85289.1 MAG: phosphonate ABC transporter substrate-binding protein [Clostridium sp. 29_15]CDB75666.1 phosphate/phosphite/phosphonate ABC transporter periplasmic binding protein [Clostridium sp. CAG:265]